MSNVQIAGEVLLEHVIDLTIMLAPLADQEGPSAVTGGAVAFLHGPAAQKAQEGAHCAALYFNEPGSFVRGEPLSQARALAAHLLTLAPHTLAGMELGDSVGAIHALREALVFAHELAEDVGWTLSRKVDR